MIRIVYDRANHRLTVTGHAGAAPHGEDLVCAAVSALVCTIAEAVRRMERNRQAEQAVIRLGAGDAEIAFRSDYGCLANAVMDSLCLGLECLAQEYPQYVKWDRE